MWLALSAARHLVGPLPPPARVGAPRVGARAPACGCVQQEEDPHAQADPDAQAEPPAPPRRLPEHLAVIMDGNSRWVCPTGLEPRTSRLRARPQPTRHGAPDRTATHTFAPRLGQAHRERRPRREGHWAGVDAIRSLVDGVLDLEHVATLTVYAMSIENLLRRPAAEVEWLLVCHAGARTPD
eukprot:scaffold115842_cov52-Phaeocystis_antarctica.AAC.1